MHISAREVLTASLVSGRSLRNSLETKSKAYSGHLLNQSSVQQLTSDGNCLHLTLRVSPTGLIQRQMWRYSLTLSMNKLLMFSIVSTIFFWVQIGLSSFAISSLSSGAIRFGISPVFKRLFRFSMKVSSIICVSVMTKEMPYPPIPASFM